MSILPIVGVQQSIEQIPVLIQSSPPANSFFPPVEGAPVAIIPVEKIRGIRPVSTSRNGEGISGKREDQEDRKGGAGDRSKEDSSRQSPSAGSGPVRVQKEPEGHLDLMV